MRAILVFLLVLTLGACNLPALATVSPPPTSTLVQPSLTLTPTEVLCGFVEGRQQLKDLSDQLLERLKNAGLPVKNSRAEAYGENCLASDGSLVRFSARETDYYLTLAVRSIDDEASLGNLLEKSIRVIGEFPVGSTPGPQPGYIGVTFEAGNSTRNTWFLRSKAEGLLLKGVSGAELYRSLSTNP
ncbi:MAG TPA: hypothetical protein VGK00_09545 [Anaerolineales bacterium]